MPVTLVQLIVTRSTVTVDGNEGQTIAEAAVAENMLALESAVAFNRDPNESHITHPLAPSGLLPRL